MVEFHTLTYLSCDIPPGMTLAEYRRARVEPVKRRTAQSVLAQLVRYARGQGR